MIIVVKEEGCSTVADNGVCVNYGNADDNSSNSDADADRSIVMTAAVKDPTVVAS